MPAPLAARGIIITVSLLAAVALAAYENENLRAWVDRTRQKIAMGLHNLGDEIQPRRPLSEKRDASMSEDVGDAAEQRRRQARAEILERGRILEEKKRQKSGSKRDSPSSSFDSLVDQDGKLRADTTNEKQKEAAITTSTDAVEVSGTIRSRRQIPIEADVHHSVDASLPVRHLAPRIDPPSTQSPFESMYEQEMRNTWNMPFPSRSVQAPSTRASESLLDLTPTTEDFPDPDFSVPSSHVQHRRAQSEYFSATVSCQSSHTLSENEPEFYYAHPSRPFEPLQPRLRSQDAGQNVSVSSVPSIAGSTDHVHPSQADISEDDLISEPDGIRTPASAWTEVESNVSEP